MSELTSKLKLYIFTFFNNGDNNHLKL